MAQAIDQYVALSAVMRTLLTTIDNTADRVAREQYHKHGQAFTGATKVARAVQEVIRPWYPLLNALACNIEIPGTEEVHGGDNHAAEGRSVQQHPDVHAANLPAKGD